MSTRTTRGNRWGLGIVGLLLLGLGGYVLARSLGAFGAGQAGEPVYTETVATWIHQNSWVWICVVAVAAVIGLLALRWLLVQLRAERLHRIRIDVQDGSDPVTAGPDLAAGVSSVQADAVTGAVGREIEDYPGIRSVRSYLAGAPDEPTLFLKVVIDADADVARLRRRIVTDAVGNARIALDDPYLPAQLQLGVARPVANRPTEL